MPDFLNLLFFRIFASYICKVVKRNIFIGLMLGMVSMVCAQQQQTVVKRMKTWRLSERLGIADTIPPDTAFLNYPQNNLVDRYSMANAYNGNLVSPIEPKIFFDRYTETDFLFANPYNPYIITPTDVTYYNTTTPYSNITYRSGGSTYRDEDHVNFIFTGNANKRTNFGVTLDYLYPRGEYANQSASRFAGTLFGSYNGKHYEAHGSLVYNKLKNFENGGITDPDGINTPVATYDIPVNLNAMSAYNYLAGYYAHQYSIGIERDVQVSEDSVAQVFVPVTSFKHTLKIDRAAKRYVEQEANTFYPNTYKDSVTANTDTAAVFTIKNVLAVTFKEEFNKWLGFGLTVFAENEVQRFTNEQLDQDSIMAEEWKSNTRVGGILSRERGKYIRYSFGGDVCLIGYKLGEFNLNGELEGRFRLFKDTFSLNANAYIRNEEPSYYLQHYVSNHFRWDNDFAKTYRTYVGGSINYSTKYVSTNLKVGVENLTRYIYFNEEGLPAQHDGNIQVLAADLQLDLRYGKFALENHAVYQLSSSSLLPLPTLSLYHNLYYYDLWFKVLSVQLGVDMRYHTAYYAPVLVPATGQFRVQNTTRVGNYPFMNVYANFHLKTVRFFVEYTNLGELFLDRNYFSMPNYPLNPAVLKFGISWNFYD